MAILGIIADDFTGATDIAGMLVKGGMRTIQTIGLPAQGTIPDDVDAVVVALKTRSIAAGDAIAQSLDALKALQAAVVKPTWGEAVGKSREVYYPGEPFAGKPTRVFAYYSKPAGDGPFPAVRAVARPR